MANFKLFRFAFIQRHTELSAKDVSEQDLDKKQRSVRTETALQQPAIPTDFKEILPRAQTQFSPTGSSSPPSHRVPPWGGSEGWLPASCCQGPLDPGRGVQSGGRMLQCPGMSRALFCHEHSMCLFLPSSDSSKPSSPAEISASKLHSGMMLCYRS